MRTISNADCFKVWVRVQGERTRVRITAARPTGVACCQERDPHGGFSTRHPRMVGRANVSSAGQGMPPAQGEPSVNCFPSIYLKGALGGTSKAPSDGHPMYHIHSRCSRLLLNPEQQRRMMDDTRNRYMTLHGTVD